MRQQSTQDDAGSNMETKNNSSYETANKDCG